MYVVLTIKTFVQKKKNNNNKDHVLLKRKTINKDHVNLQVSSSSDQRQRPRSRKNEKNNGDCPIQSLNKLNFLFEHRHIYARKYKNYR